MKVNVPFHKLYGFTELYIEETLLQKLLEFGLCYKHLHIYISNCLTTLFKGTNQNRLISVIK